MSTNPFALKLKFDEAIKDERLIAYFKENDLKLWKLKATYGWVKSDIVRALALIVTVKAIKELAKGCKYWKAVPNYKGSTSKALDWQQWDRLNDTIRRKAQELRSMPQCMHVSILRGEGLIVNDLLLAGSSAYKALVVKWSEVQEEMKEKVTQ